MLMPVSRVEKFPSKGVVGEHLQGPGRADRDSTLPATSACNLRAAGLCAEVLNPLLRKGRSPGECLASKALLQREPVPALLALRPRGF